MNSKERVREALAFKEPDRVPCGFYAIDNDTVQKILGRPSLVRNKAKTKIALWEGRRDEVVGSFIEDSLELFKKLDDVIDIINLNTELYPLLPPKSMATEPVPKKIADDTWKDGSGRIYKYSPITEDIVLVHDPNSAITAYTVDQFPLQYDQYAEDSSIYEAVDAITQEFKNDKFIMGPFPAAKELILPGSFERGLEMMLLEPEIMECAVLSAMAEAESKRASWTNRGFDALFLGEDFSYNQGPFMSLPLFRRFCFPQMVFNTDFAHAHGLPFIHHACGNNWTLLDSFMEAKTDCYQSIQESAGMDLKEVKCRTYGKMAIWGGLPVEDLISGTRKKVREDVQRAIEIGQEGGGYIFGTSHSIAIGSKYENVMEMFETFVKKR